MRDLEIPDEPEAEGGRDVPEAREDRPPVSLTMRERTIMTQKTEKQLAIRELLNIVGTNTDIFDRRKLISQMLESGIFKLWCKTCSKTPSDECRLPMSAPEDFPHEIILERV